MGGKIRADAGTSFCGRKLNFISSVNQDHPAENRNQRLEWSKSAIVTAQNGTRKGLESHMVLLVVLKAHMKLVTMNLIYIGTQVLLASRKPKRFNPPIVGFCLVDNS